MYRKYHSPKLQSVIKYYRIFLHRSYKSLLLVWSVFQEINDCIFNLLKGIFVEWLFDVYWVSAAAAAKSLQSCPTLCNPIDSSPPGSPIPGILQTRTLEWVAISFSNAWKWKVKVKSFTGSESGAYQAPPSMGVSRQEYWSGLPLLSPLSISVQFSRSVMFDSLRPHELQHARPPCSSPTPRVHSNSCPWSRWCHPAISSSVVPFSSCPQSLPASESFPMSQLFTWGGQSNGVSASASFLPKNT